jgi:hypothetical protein
LKIILKTKGDLRDYFGREPHDIILPEHAGVQELLVEIGRRWGMVLPGYMWNQEKCVFRGPVFLTVDGKVIDEKKMELQDGMELTIVRALAGG